MNDNRPFHINFKILKQLVLNYNKVSNFAVYFSDLHGKSDKNNTRFYI